MLAIAALLSLCACAHGNASPDAANAPAPCNYASARDGTQSVDILCTDPVSAHVKVKHILIAWGALSSPNYTVDPRAATRTKAQAQALARELLAKIRAGAAIEPLMAKYSEDPGSAASGMAYDVTPGAQLVPPFKSLSLRLHMGQAGIVESAFGLHVIQRVPEK